MMNGRDKTIVLGSVALGLSISSIVLAYRVLNLGTWSWLIGGLVMTLCLLTYFYFGRGGGREAVARIRTTDDEGFQKMERVLNRTVNRQGAGPLWKSRTYSLNQGDMLKVDVRSDREVTARLVRVVQGSAMEEIDGSHGSYKTWSKVSVIPTNGEYRIVLDALHPQVTITVRIGHRPTRLL